jgi:hypothetical protein
MNFELKDAVGVGFSFISEEHIFTFLLSSPFTARTLVKEKGDVEAVQFDLKLSLILSIAISLILSYIFKSESTAIFGAAFGFLLYYIYAIRGVLL